jgi:hypothetical protein
MRIAVTIYFLAFIGRAAPVLAQESLEIDNRRVSIGMGQDQAVKLFAKAEMEREGKYLMVIRPTKIGKNTLDIVVGKVYFEERLVVGACRSWDYDNQTDAELFRVFLGGLRSISNGQEVTAALVVLSRR